MGVQTSRQEEDEHFLRELDKNYLFLKEFTDKRFGEVQVYKHKSNEQYVARKGQLFNTEEEFGEYVKLANKRLKVQHDNIITLKHYTDANENSYCGDFNKLTLYFDYYFLDLEKELDRRRQNSEFLKETELWYLLESLLSTGYYLQQNNIYHGDYQPLNILLTSEGQIKIADHGILRADQSGYFKMLSQTGNALLSPILLEALQTRQTTPVHDFWKSDIFSLGMTVLEVAALAPPYYCYDFAKNVINEEKLQELFNHVQGRYGKFLITILKDMLHFNEQIRPNFVDLNTVLAPYQQDIQNFRPIDPPMNQSTVVYQQPLAQTQVVQQLPSYIQRPPQTVYVQTPVIQSQIITTKPVQVVSPQPPSLQASNVIPNGTSSVYYATPQQPQQTAVSFGQTSVQRGPVYQ